MARYDIHVAFPWQGRMTSRLVQLCRMFGLTADRLREHVSEHQCTLEIRTGDIVYITGPSGAGKSVLLREIQSRVPPEERINLADIELPADRTVVDCLDGELLNDLRLLGMAALSDVFCLCTPPACLSDGQKYRFRLAMALATGKGHVFADEFCSDLDRITASAVACQIRRYARQTRTTFVLASSHDDILLDLQPDVLVLKHFTGPAEVIYKSLGHESEIRNPKSAIRD